MDEGKDGGLVQLYAHGLGLSFRFFPFFPLRSFSGLYFVVGSIVIYSSSLTTLQAQYFCIISLLSIIVNLLLDSHPDLPLPPTSSPLVIG